LKVEDMCEDIKNELSISWEANTHKRKQDY